MLACGGKLARPCGAADNLNWVGVVHKQARQTIFKGLLVNIMFFALRIAADIPKGLFFTNPMKYQRKARPAGERPNKKKEWLSV